MIDDIDSDPLKLKPEQSPLVGRRLTNIIDNCCRVVGSGKDSVFPHWVLACILLPASIHSGDSSLVVGSGMFICVTFGRTLYHYCT